MPLTQQCVGGWLGGYARMHVCALSLSRVQFFTTPWTGALQAPLSMGFSRQEYWSGLPFPSPGNLPDAGIKPASPALASPTKPPGKLLKSNTIIIAGHEWCISAANSKAYSKRERVDVQLLG